MGEQLSMIRTTPDRAGQWERLAAKRVRELTRAGYLTPATQGYADALRMAGRTLDYAEAMGSTRDRVAAANAWQATMARIVPAPAEHATAASGADDPWQDLAHVLRGAAMGD